MTTAEFDDASLRQAIANAEEIARLSPDNPEAMPVLGPQTYGTSKAYFDDVANVTPDWRASAAATAIDLSKQKASSPPDSSTRRRRSGGGSSRACLPTTGGLPPTTT